MGVYITRTCFPDENNPTHCGCEKSLYAQFLFHIHVPLVSTLKSLKLPMKGKVFLKLDFTLVVYLDDAVLQDIGMYFIPMLGNIIKIEVTV